MKPGEVKLATAEEVMAICRTRGCVAAPFTKIILDVAEADVPRAVRRPATEIRADDDGPRWKVTEVLKACRKAKGLKVPSSTPPDGVTPDKTWNEAAIAGALAADGVVVYANGDRTNSLRWALGWRNARVQDPDRICEVLELCGLAEPGGLMGRGFRLTEAAVNTTPPQKLIEVDDDAVWKLRE